MEDVGGVDGGGAALLAAEDEVDPLVQVRRDIVALQRLPARGSRRLCALGYEAPQRK